MSILREQKIHGIAIKAYNVVNPDLVTHRESKYDFLTCDSRIEN